jgi:dolichol-phosphate mannosyltransferase
MLSVLGGLVALAAFAYAAVVLVSWLARDIPVRGYAPVVILLAFTAGIQMMMLGVLGEYLWRALDETRRRPPFVVDEHFRRAAPADAAPADAAREAGAPDAPSAYGEPLRLAHLP